MCFVVGMEKLIVVLALVLAVPAWAQDQKLDKYIEPANLCPVHPDEYKKALTKLRSFRESLEEAPECQTLGENLQNVEDAYSEADYKRIKNLIQNEEGRAKELSPSEVEEVRAYAQKVSSTVAGFVELFSSNKKCLEKEKRPSLLSNIASVVQTTTNLVGKATGPGGIPLQVGGGLFAGILNGIDGFFSKGSGYNFDKSPEHRQLFATQLCIYNDIRTDAVDLIHPERRVEFLTETFQKKYLVAKYNYLTKTYPVCNQLSNYYYQNNFYIRDIIKLKSWVKSVRDSNDSSYDKCLEINSQVHKNKKSSFLSLQDSVSKYPYGYDEIARVESGYGEVGTSSSSTATGATLEWIDHVGRNTPDLEVVAERSVIVSPDGEITQVVVQESAAEFSASPYHATYSWEQEYIEAAKKTAQKAIEQIEVDPFLCSDRSVQRANEEALDTIEQYVSLLRKNSTRVLEDLRDEANKSDDVFGESVGDFLLTTISKYKWAKDEIYRLSELLRPGSSSARFELKEAVSQLDERLFGVLAPDFLDYHIEEGIDDAKDYDDERNDWLKARKKQLEKIGLEPDTMNFKNELENIIATTPSEDYRAHAGYYASIEQVAKPLESALFAMNSVNESCHFFAISGTYFPEIASQCNSEGYNDLRARVGSYEADILALHQFVAFEKQNIGIASGWSHVLLRKIENWFNYRGESLQTLLE